MKEKKSVSEKRDKEKIELMRFHFYANHKWPLQVACLRRCCCCSLIEWSILQSLYIRFHFNFNSSHHFFSLSKRIKRDSQTGTLVLQLATVESVKEETKAETSIHIILFIFSFIFGKKHLLFIQNISQAGYLKKKG